MDSSPSDPPPPKKPCVEEENEESGEILHEYRICRYLAPRGSKNLWIKLPDDIRVEEKDVVRNVKGICIIDGKLSPKEMLAEISAGIPEDFGTGDSIDTVVGEISTHIESQVYLTGHPKDFPNVDAIRYVQENEKRLHVCDSVEFR